MVIDRDIIDSRPDAGRAREPGATAWGARGQDERDTAFAALMGTLQPAAGLHVEIPRGEEGLDKQMFEPPPADERSRNLAAAREEYKASDTRDPRAVRYDRADDSMNAPPRAEAALARQEHPGVASENRPSQGVVDSAIPAGNHADSQRFSRWVEAHGSEAERGTPSRLPMDVSGVKQGATHNVGASSAATASTQAITGSVAGAGSVNAAPSARLTGMPSPAQQVGQLLKTGLHGETESARSVVGSDSRAESRNVGQRGGQSHLEGGPSSRSGGASGSERASQSDRAAEPTPFDQMVRSIRMRSGEKISSARMRLDPPELGRMRVDVRVVGERAEIHVRTETPEAAYRLHDRAIELKTALEQHGIRVDRFDVQVETASFDVFSRGSDGSGHASVDRGFGGPVYDGFRRSSDQSEGGHESGWFEPDLAKLWNSGQWFSVAERRIDVRV